MTTPVISDEESLRAIADLKRVRAEDALIFEELLEQLREENVVLALKIEELQGELTVARAEAQAWKDTRHFEANRNGGMH